MPTSTLASLNILWKTAFNNPILLPYEQSLGAVLDPLLRAEGSLHTLPSLVSRTLHKDPIQLTALTTAWSCIYRAAKLFDDVEDGDSPLALSEAINQGLGLLWVAHGLLENPATPWSAESRLAVLNRLHPCLLRATAGQHLDIVQANHPSLRCTPDEWTSIAAAKSGELMAWVTWASAWVLTEDGTIADAFADFGMNLGILLQVLDDFEGVWGKDANDLAQPALTLTLCYATMVADGEMQAILTRLIEQAQQGDTAAVAALRSHLEALGTREFLWAVAQHHAQAALAAVAPLSAVDPLPLQQFLRSIFPFLQ